jgi:hypothetical protein
VGGGQALLPQGQQRLERRVQAKAVEVEGRVAAAASGAGTAMDGRNA